MARQQARGGRKTTAAKNAAETAYCGMAKRAVGSGHFLKRRQKKHGARRGHPWCAYGARSAWRAWAWHPVGDRNGGRLAAD
jgi:hypothetical protein